MAYIKFTKKHKLKKHVGTVHEGIKPFKCSQCLWCQVYNHNHRFRNFKLLFKGFVLLSLDMINTDREEMEYGFMIKMEYGFILCLLHVYMFLQFMKERSLSNVTFPISTVPKKLTWKSMLHMFMKKPYRCDICDTKRRHE